MRIALLSDRHPPDPGGLARSSARLAAAFAAAGDHVDVFAVDPAAPTGRLQVTDQAGVRVLRYGAHRREEDTCGGLLDQLLRADRERDYALVQGMYLVRSGFLAAYAGRLLGIPSLISARGNDLDRAVLDPARATHVLRALDLASCVTAPSQELARKARALAPAARVELVPNGVDTRLFRPLRPGEDERRTLGLAGRSVVGFSGELRVKKGLVPLLQAFAQLTRDRPVSLLLAGGVRADDAGTLQVFRRREPLAHVVCLPMADPAGLPRIYGLMDVFVHPSLHDGLPNALLEAMACARPVVAAEAGGIPDALRDNRDGLLVPAGDATALATAVARLLDDRALGARLAASARERIRRDFRPEQEVRRYRELHAELTGRTLVPRARARRAPAAAPVRAAR